MSSERFLRTNAPFLSAGAALTFASSFGQTYFIAVFAGYIRRDFDLTNGQWGGLYTFATLVSAIALIHFGKYADTVRIRTLALVTIATFVVVTLTMAASRSVLVLALVILGLRFCGQGMMSHLAMTAMGRWFARRRGRAVAIAVLGFSVGEAILPVSAVTLSMAWGWRTTWFAIAVFLATIMAPLILWLLRKERTPGSLSDLDHAHGLDGRHWTRRDALRDPLFWILMPGFLGPPFIGTAVFFHQVHLTGHKGWSLMEYTAAAPVFAASAILFSFISGWACDKWGALRIMPAYLAPMGIGLILIALSSTIWIVPVAYVFMGMTQGGSNAALGALWPELYGTRHLGSIRALAVAGMVFASAFGPGVTGLLIDTGISFEIQMIWMAVYLVLMSAILIVLTGRMAQHRSATTSN